MEFLKENNHKKFHIHCQRPSILTNDSRHSNKQNPMIHHMTPIVMDANHVILETRGQTVNIRVRWRAVTVPFVSLRNANRKNSLFATVKLLFPIFLTDPNKDCSFVEKIHPLVRLSKDMRVNHQ